MTCDPKYDGHTPEPWHWTDIDYPESDADRELALDAPKLARELAECRAILKAVAEHIESIARDNKAIADELRERLRKYPAVHPSGKEAGE